MSQETVRVKNAFALRNIILSDFWLTSCLQWVYEQNSDHNLSHQEVNIKVYEQWLMLDLRDVDVPILPPNVSQEQKLILEGQYSLQLLDVVDISKSKYSQLQSIRNKDSEVRVGERNPETNSAKRMLQLTLTDGLQEILAIEYTPINVLDINLTPGIKIRIIGPVTVRRGRLVLESSHVRVLGGEVEELLIPNAPENILARALNLPENPNPHSVDNNNPSGQSIQSTTNYSNVEGNDQSNVNQHVEVQNSNNYAQESVVPTTNRLNLQNDSPSNDDFITEEEDDRIMAEVDMLLEAEKDVLSSRTTQETPSCSHDNKNTAADSSFFEDIDIEAHLDQIDAEITVNDSKKPKGYFDISALLKIRPNVTVGRFKVKAKFKAVIQKLTVTDDCWCMKIVVEDDTGEMTVFLHTDIVSDLMGYHPSAIMSLKQNILLKDSCATSKVMKAIEDFKAKIVQLNCLMEIAFKSRESDPEIIKLFS